MLVTANEEGERAATTMTVLPPVMVMVTVTGVPWLLALAALTQVIVAKTGLTNPVRINVEIKKASISRLPGFFILT